MNIEQNEGTNRLISVLLEQSPDVANQIIQAGYIDVYYSTLASLIVMVVGLVLAVFCYKKFKKHSYDPWPIGIFVGCAAMLICTTICIINVREFWVLKNAPKAYIVEKLMK
jgi:hypothetical protein